jgi:pseudaminic acid cytidylyltransferase
MKVAVIPARGGSKRIPRKNIRLFGGKPIIYWPIRAALEADCFDNIIVSTDDEEIAAISREFGASTPFVRPLGLADDYTGIVPVVSHSIEAISSKHSHPTEVCCIFATAPLVQVEDLLHGLELIESADWEYVFSATAYSYPVHRSFLKDSDGGIQMMFPANLDKRSQDLPQVMHDAGQFYWGKDRAWLEKKPILAKHSCPLVLPDWRVRDIDTLDDWQVAELIFERLSSQRHS